jgi:hypothetical protein
LLATVRGIIVKIHQGITESLVKSLASELQRGDLTRLSSMTCDERLTVCCGCCIGVGELPIRFLSNLPPPLFILIIREIIKFRNNDSYIH